ncbi:MAG: mechanosensitive ion channel family protein [Balneolaceae bacterium]
MQNEPDIPANQFGEQIARWLTNTPDFYGYLLETAVVILVLIAARYIILKIVHRNIQEPSQRYKWRKNLAYTLGFFGFILIGNIWFEGMGSLATFLGLLSAGLVIALRDPIVDIAGWIFILWRKPFDVGDRIQLDQNKGDVIDIRLFKFSILEIGNWVHADQSTGRVIHIPNHVIFSDSVANYTSDFDFIWNEIEIVVTFESNWQKAKRILEEISGSHLEEYVKDADQQIQKASRSYLIRYNFLTPIVYTEVVGHGIKLTIRHLSDPRKRRSTTQSIWEDVLTRFQKEEDVGFAYQTYRIYQNQIEGKPGLKP